MDARLKLYDFAADYCYSRSSVGITQDSTTNARVSRTEDIKTMTTDLVAADVFTWMPGRHHASFRNIKANPFNATNMAKMHAWLKRLRRRFSIQQMVQLEDESSDGEDLGWAGWQKFALQLLFPDLQPPPPQKKKKNPPGFPYPFASCSHTTSKIQSILFLYDSISFIHCQILPRFLQLFFLFLFFPCTWDSFPQARNVLS